MSVLSIAETITSDIHTKKRPFDSGHASDQDGVWVKRARNSLTNGAVHEAVVELTTTKPLFQHEVIADSWQTPKEQSALLLLELKKPYMLTTLQAVPKVNSKDDEVLIKIHTIGLNPIDWKAPDYGFGIPELPYIAGRDLVGVIVSDPPNNASFSTRYLKKGDIVSSASTDYRDLRKAAYQEFAVASRYNISRVPQNVRKEKVAGVGVAFIAAVLALGICLGADFSTLEEPVKGPNLKEILREKGRQALPEDVREECLSGIDASEGPVKGDWVAIWGGSSATALMVAQLCKVLGLRVIKVLDIGKHGEHLSQGPADLLVDSHDPERAIDIIRNVTRGRLRLAIDVVGRPTAELLRRTMQYGDEKTATEYQMGAKQSHLVGLTGLPKVPVSGIKQHTVPIKVHHEVPEIGEALMVWLERLLAEEKIVPPAQEVIDGGLDKVNVGLDRMRKGEISGKRLAVKLE